MILSAVAVAFALQAGGVTVTLNPPVNRAVRFRQTGRIDRKSGSTSTFLEYTVRFDLKRIAGPGPGVTMIETVREAGIFPSANSEDMEEIPKLAKGMAGLQLTSTFDAKGFAGPRSAAGGGRGALELYQMAIGEPLGFYGLVFPGRALTKDASWTTRIDLGPAAKSAAPVGATTTVSEGIPVTFRFVSAANGRVTIESVTKGSTTVTYRLNDHEGKPVRQSMTLTLDGKAKLVFEQATGLPVRVDIESLSVTRAGSRVTEVKTKSTLTRDG